MNKLFLQILFCYLCAIPLHAQFSIRGKIIDSESKEPITGVSVYLPDLKTGAATDTNGIFIIRHVPGGTFLADIRMIGYAGVAIHIKSDSEAKLSDSVRVIELIRTPAEYHPVIVTGVSGTTERLRSTVPTAMNTRDHILKHGSTNAVGSVTEIPGIASVSTGNAIAKPVIRGLGYNRVVVLRNNIRQEGQQWGDEHGLEIDEFEIDRVEIIKGPGSIMYGSDAMAGVINFMTPQPVVDGKSGGEFMSTYQQNGSLIGNSFMTEGNKHGFNWQFRVSHKLAGNYSTPADGYVANTGFREFNFSGNAGLNRQWGVTQIGFSSFNQTLGLPEGERDSTGQFIVPRALNDSVIEFPSFTSEQLKGYHFHIGIPRQQVTHHRVVSSSHIFLKRSSMKVDIGFQQNKRLEFGDILNPSEEEIAMRLNTVNANVNYFLPEKEGSQFTTGFSSQVQTNTNTGAEYIIPDYLLVEGGAYLFYRKYFEKLLISAGVRGDFRNVKSQGLYLDSLEQPADSSIWTSTKFTPLNRNFISFSGVAGASYRFSEKVVVRMNLARGFRSPNLSELSSNGRHEGTFRYEIGNSQLKPEISLQGDLGVTVNTDHFNLELSTFCNDINNFIYLNKLSSVLGGDSIADPSDPAPVFSFTQGHAFLYGGEIYTDLHPHPLDWLHFENSLSVVYSALQNQPDSMKYLPFTPPMKYQSEINAHMEKAHGIFSNAYAGISIAHYFAQGRIYSAYGTETGTPSYTLMEFGTGTDFVNKSGKVVLKFFFSVSNLLNTEYQSHLNRLKYAPVNPATGRTGIFNPGRNFTFRIVIPFSYGNN